MSRATPGPWLIADGTFVYALNLEGSNRFSAGVQSGWRTEGRVRTDREELEANAHLIAAAPELLEALRWYVENDDTNEHADNEFWLKGRDNARAALAKATGSQP
jgi:hypothetical protein